MTERAIDAVVFDYGGVLTTTVREYMAAFLAADRIDPDRFAAVMQAWLGRDAPDGTPIHRLETGELSGAEFERLLAAELVTVDGAPVTAAGLLSRMSVGMKVVPAMIDLLAQSRAAGLRVGLLSNSWANEYPAELADYCDPMVISGELGLRKPDPRIYQVLLDRLDVPPARIAFVDDAPINVATARELGMYGIRHTDPETTRAALAELVPDLPAVIR